MGDRLQPTPTMEAQAAPGQPGVNQRFQVARRNKEEGKEEGSEGSALSEETKRKVDAAKSYIENMYKTTYQNIQERYAR